MTHSKVLLIGAGKMGGALLTAWQKADWPDGSVQVIETDSGQVKILSEKNTQVVSSVDQVMESPACIVLAVKPQSMDELLPSLARKFGTHPLYLSIAAGKALGYYEQHLGHAAAIVRAMPNTPALIGKGISALVANGNVNMRQKDLAAAVLGAAGEVVWLDDESQMDAVTAVSGSGPAYVFLFMEALVQAGVAQGLSEEIAKKLAMQTVLGASELAKKSKESLEQLRKNVTSPGGTTEAALIKFMENDNFRTLIKFAVAEAVKRSKELA